MDQEWSVPGWAVLASLAALVVVVLVLGLALVRARSRGAAALDAARRQAADLQQRVDAIERRLAEPTTATPTAPADDQEYVITVLGHDRADDPDAAGRSPVPAVPGPLFADLVLREGVVQAASLAAGLRRALAPETRHRIRFEMRREVKRARKQRRADLRRAKREYDARQRATLPPDESAA